MYLLWWPQALPPLNADNLEALLGRIVQQEAQRQPLPHTPHCRSVSSSASRRTLPCALLGSTRCLLCTSAGWLCSPDARKALPLWLLLLRRRRRLLARGQLLLLLLLLLHRWRGLLVLLVLGC